jgi:hypothetical protein
MTLNVRLAPNLVLLAVASASASAQDIQAGLWKISLQSSVTATPGWKPEPYELTQCLTEADARNPAQLLTGMGSQGVTGCEFANRHSSGSRISFDLTCAGQLGITGHGEMSVSAAALEGVLDVSFGGSDRTLMHNTLHAARVGDCGKEDRPAAAAQGSITPSPVTLPPPVEPSE